MVEKYETIIIGAGFGGLSAAQKLGKKKRETLVIDKKNHHLFQPLLYQVATAGLSPSNIATPIREVLKKYASVSVVMDEVLGVDLKSKVIRTKNKHEYQYENLIVAAGAKHSYFGNDQWEQFAPGLKTISDALKIRETMLTNFEKSEQEQDFIKQNALNTFVVIGGGPTGVEMAGAIAEIAKKTLTKNFSNIDPAKSKVFLLEGADRLLAAFDEKLSARAKKDLEQLGVDVRLKALVTKIDENGVYIKDEFIPTENIIWAAGNQTNQIVASLDVEKDKMNRVIVDKDCSIPNFPQVFVIGDAAAYKDEENYLPSLAPVATQQGRYVAKNIIKKLKKGKRDPFEYVDKGSMATIGKSRAIAQFAGLKISGTIAWIMWLVVHLLFLVLFRNKVSILFSWIYNYITEKRLVRIIK